MIKSLFVSLFLLTALTAFSQSAELLAGHRYYGPFNPIKAGYDAQYSVGILFNSAIVEKSQWLMQTQADISLKDKVEIYDKGTFQRGGFSASFLFGRLLTNPKKPFGLSCYLGTSAGWRTLKNIDYEIRQSKVAGLLSIQPSYIVNRLIFRLQITPEWVFNTQLMDDNQVKDQYFNRVPLGSGTNIRSQMSIGWIF